MKWPFILLIILIGCQIPENSIQTDSNGENMKLTSIAFKNGTAIPKKYTCMDRDINPPLAWDNVPEGTKSFALIVDDPDAPEGTWTHWLVKDISPDMRTINEDQVPGIQVRNSFDKKEYGGPCPPSGNHRYYFRLYALDILTFHVENIKDFYKEVKKHAIKEAELMGTFQKS